MDKKSYKHLSRLDWFSPDDSITVDRINAGSLQRIADATEAMAGNYLKMQMDLEMYKRWYYQGCEDKKRMAKQIAALQGWVKRLKKAAGLNVSITNKK
jgi:hypothetical protein